MSNTQEIPWVEKPFRNTIIKETPFTSMLDASEKLWKNRPQLPPLVQKLLERRIANTEELDAILSPSLKNLSAPWVLQGMRPAVERIQKAFKDKEKILIYADFDMDGTPGLCLLYEGMRALGFENLTPFQPLRLSQGYGLHNDVIKTYANQGHTLIITIDLGITAVEQVAYANTLGVDVIITDHHLPKEVLPEALAIVNPNSGLCDSGMGYLCGAGVAFYVLLALYVEWKKDGILPEGFDIKESLDCLTLGTVTDMVPLVRENRILVKYGLPLLARTRRPGLKVLLEALDLYGSDLTAFDVGMKFAPKLNALSRLEMGLKPIDIFLCETEEKAKTLIGEVLSINQKRMYLQNKALETAKICAKKQDGSRAIWVYSDDFHQGIIGLVASRLAEEFGKPAFVGTVKHDGSVVGSARFPREFSGSLVEAMASCSSLNHFGGHAKAAGFGLSLENALSFATELNEYFEAQSVTAQIPPKIYDCAATIEELDPKLVGWLEALEPFGMDFEKPRFFLNAIVLRDYHELKGGHLRLVVCDPVSSGQNREMLWFSPQLDEGIKAYVGRSLQVIVELSVNRFRGRKSLQLQVKELCWVEA